MPLNFKILISAIRCRLLIGILLHTSTSYGLVPSAPANLHVNFVTRLEIALQWDPVPSATKYKAEMRESACSSCPFVSYGPNALISGPYLRIGNLIENVQYDIKVYAGNSDGWSTAASLIDDPSVTPVDAPDPPTEVLEVSFDESSVTLTWDAPTHPAATHYQIFLSECSKQIGQSNCTGQTPCLTDHTVQCSDYSPYTMGSSGGEWLSTIVAVQGLHEDHIYFFYVTARNLNINGYQYGGSPPVHFTPTRAYSGAATNLVVQGVRDTSVLLAWTAAPGAVEYRVQWRAPIIGDPWTGSATVAGTAYEVTALTTGMQYDFRVLARNLYEPLGSGAFEWAGDASGSAYLDQDASNVVGATPQPPLTASPTGLSVTGYAATEVRLAWLPTTGALYYQLQYRHQDRPDAPLEPWSVYGGAAPVQFTTPAAAATQLDTGVAYEFRVTAHNLHVISPTYKGYTGPSDPVVATPSPPPPPPAGFSVIAHRGLLLRRCEPTGCPVVAATAMSITLDAGASAQPQAYSGAVVRIVIGQGRNQVRHIVSYDGAARLATLSAPWAVAPSAAGGSTYEVTRYPVGPDRCTLTWARVAGATRYLVTWRRAGLYESLVQLPPVLGPDGGPATGGCAAVLPDGSANPALPSQTTLCLEVTGLVVGTEYEFAIAAGNDYVDWGAPAGPVAVSALSEPSEIPREGQVVAQDDTSVTMDWAGPSAGSGTAFYLAEVVTLNGTVAAGSWDLFGDDAWTVGPLLDVFGDDVAGYRIPGLRRGGGHVVRVNAGNLAGFAYPSAAWVLPSPARSLAVGCVRSWACLGNGSACALGQVTLAWSAPPMGFYFRVLARRAVDVGPFTDLLGGGPALNVTAIVLNATSFPAGLPLAVNLPITYQVVSGNEPDGPFEGIGTTVTVATVARAPVSASAARAVLKSLGGFRLTWLPPPAPPAAAYFVVQVPRHTCFPVLLYSISYPSEIDQDLPRCAMRQPARSTLTVQEQTRQAPAGSFSQSPGSTGFWGTCSMSTLHTTLRSSAVTSTTRTAMASSQLARDVTRAALLSLPAQGQCLATYRLLSPA